MAWVAWAVGTLRDQVLRREESLGDQPPHVPAEDRVEHPAAVAPRHDETRRVAACPDAAQPDVTHPPPRLIAVSSVMKRVGQDGAADCLGGFPAPVKRGDRREGEKGSRQPWALNRDMSS